MKQSGYSYICRTDVAVCLTNQANRSCMSSRTSPPEGKGVQHYQHAQTSCKCEQKRQEKGIYILPSSVPANCLSPFPLLPNLVTIFPFGWKMKTQHALLSTTMMCPLRSTETPLGPMSFPDPILA